MDIFEWDNFWIKIKLVQLNLAFRGQSQTCLYKTKWVSHIMIVIIKDS